MKPNIIIFNPDQMRSDALAHLGNPASSTPYLDAFQRTEAVSFRNAFCQSPVCVPSRCSFFTGMYPHVRGHRTMQYLLHPDEPNLFGELKHAGYHVWMNDRNDLLAAQIPGWLEANADEIFHPDLNLPGYRPVNSDFRGEPDGKNYYSHYRGRLEKAAAGVCVSKDDQSVNAAVQRILCPPDNKPLCLFLGLSYPHPPYGVEEPYFSLTDRKLLPVRAGIGTDKFLLQQELRKYMHMESYTEEDWNELRACYLGMCRKIDDQFHRVCDALKEAGMYDNSAIFFLSDHGDYTGDYGLPEKAQNTFEDCLTRVPLLIKPPKGMPVDPGITDSLAELVDFYATVMDYASVSPTQDHFGMSLRPVVENRSCELRSYVYSEGGRLPHEYQCDEFHAAAGSTGTIPASSTYYPRQMAQTDPEAHAKGTMIRSHNYKYIHRSSGAHEFYDLQLDPLEEHNVFKDPRYAPQIQAMRMEMLNWYQNTCDRVPREYDLRFSPEVVWKQYEAECPPEAAGKIKSLIRSGAGGQIIQAALAEYRKKSEG